MAQAGEGPWFYRADLDRPLAQAAYDPQTQALVRGFAEEGWALIEAEVPDFEARLRRIIRDLARHYDHENRIQDAWLYHPDVRALATAPGVLELLGMLYRREPMPFQTLNFPVGTEQGLHSDATHFQTVPEGYVCSVWMPLEEVDSANGPLYFYPASHRLKPPTMQDLGLAATAEGYWRYEEALGAWACAQGLARREAHVRPGQAVVYAGGLLHGGSRILDRSRTRHSQVTDFFFAGCAYYVPRLSDLAAGRLSLRDDVNILTGRRLRHELAGRTVHPGLRERWLSAKARFFLRRPCLKALARRLKRAAGVA